MINRATLKKFHLYLEKYLEEKMGYCCGIQNGIVEELGKSYNIKELKQETMVLKKEYDEMLYEMHELKDELNEVIDYKEITEKEIDNLKNNSDTRNEFEILTLQERNKELEEKVTFLEKVIYFILELMDRFGLYELKKTCMEFMVNDTYKQEGLEHS